MRPIVRHLLAGAAGAAVALAIVFGSPPSALLPVAVSSPTANVPPCTLGKCAVATARRQPGGAGVVRILTE